MALDCLYPLVGLTNTSCNCWDDDKPVDFTEQNVSTSGLYISQPDTIPLRWANGSADCENGGVIELLISARNKGIREFTKNFMTAVQVNMENPYLPFTQIGDNYSNRAHPVYDTAAGIYFEPYRIKGGMLTISGVQLSFWSGVVASTDIDVNLYSSLNPTTILRTATVTVTGNKEFFSADFATPFIFDLKDIRRDQNEKFFLAYDIPVGFQPVSNDTERTACCGNRASKEELNPYLQIMCNLGGAQAATQSDLIDNPTRSDSTMQGMLVSAYFSCDYYSWLCNLSQSPDQSIAVASGERLALGMALSDGIQAQSIVSLANSLLMSSRVNKLTLISDPKKLYHIRGHYQKIADLAIRNLVFNMPKDATDCVRCRENNIIIKAPIMA